MNVVDKVLLLFLISIRHRTSKNRRPQGTATYASSLSILGLEASLSKTSAYPAVAEVIFEQYVEDLCACGSVKVELSDENVQGGPLCF